MKLKTLLMALALAAAPAAPALADAAQTSENAMTASGHAWAEVRRAVARDGVLHIKVQFLTDYGGYSGEVIYESIPPEDLNEQIHVINGDQTFPLWLEDGEADIPGKLELSFNYDPQRNPRVGKWEGNFISPGPDVTEAYLQLPNVALIGPFKIKHR